MTILPGPSNPIVYANFILQGRWRRTVSVAFGYGALIAGGIYLSTIGSSHTPDLRGWIAGLTALQFLNLLVFGAFRVESAVRADVTSRMLESHRMMPAPALGSILGYLFGAPLQAWMLAFVNFILGTVCCVISSVDLNLWAMATGIELLAAICIYAILAQFSFVARGGFLLLIISGILSIGAAGNGSLQTFPSLSVLVFPLISRSSVFVVMFDSAQMRTGSSLLTAYFISFIAQAAITAIAIRIAMRRYMSSTIIGISPPLGMMLLIVWVGLAVAHFEARNLYLSARNSFTYNGGYQSQELVAQIIEALSASCLVALLPIASAARTAAQWRRSGNSSQAKPAIAWSTPVTVFVACIIVCSLLIAPPAQVNADRTKIGMSVIIMLNFLVGMGCLFSWGYLIRRRAWIFVIFWVFLTWAGPVIIDGVYRLVKDINSDATSFTAFSPVGSLGLIWSESKIQVHIGIAGQIALSIVIGVLLLMTQRRVRRLTNSLVV